MEDEKILELYRVRSENAIEETAKKYGAYCTTIAANILLSPEDREECVSDTYLRAWNAIPPERPENLRMFLARITRNLAINRHKAMSAQKRNGEMTAVLEEMEECLTTGITPEDHIQAKELGQAINRFLRTVSKRESNVFLRRYFFSESNTQIAERYGLTAGNVNVILLRTRRKLRDYLVKEGFLYE